MQGDDSRAQMTQLQDAEKDARNCAEQAAVAAEIRDMQARAEALNMSLNRLCKAAGVSVSNLQRWRDGRATPGLLRYRDASNRVRAALTAEEDRLRKLLRVAQ